MASADLERKGVISLNELTFEFEFGLFPLVTFMSSGEKHRLENSLDKVTRGRTTVSHRVSE